MNETLESLTQRNTWELVSLFVQLEAPDMDEMQGEYAAKLLAQPNLLASLIGDAVLNNPWRRWQCKAFRPVDANNGRGYNTFRTRGKIVQRFPMKTLIAPSRFDDKPAYQLIYRHYHSFCGSVNMVDEVRRAGPGVYLGLGTYGLTRAQRCVPYPFVLVGPQADYKGDIGRERKQFQLGARELPALFAESEHHER